MYEVPKTRYPKVMIDPGPVGSQPSALRVAGISVPAKCASHPKCSRAFSGAIEITGTFSPLEELRLALLQFDVLESLLRTEMLVPQAATAHVG
jgi:hypothetical protein